MMANFVSNVDYENNRISVRTEHSESIAKKLARLKLLEERVRHGELLTSTISFIDGSQDRWFNFYW